MPVGKEYTDIDSYEESFKAEFIESVKRSEDSYRRGEFTSCKTKEELAYFLRILEEEDGA
ncbi:MAG: hypothetical protein HQK59_12275 [Deltaproteobacteria bacterium]|nr:hypothetical protein [Deltaproteobacteria bacterium]